MRSNHKLHGITIWHFLLPYIPFALPLLYLYPLTTTTNIELYRAAAVVVFGLFSCSLLIAGLRAKTFILTGKWPQLLTATLVVTMMLSLLINGDVLTSLFGIDTDYQGLLVQLSAIAIGFMAAKHANNLSFWRGATVVMGVVCTASIISDIPYILDSYRESGLILHATGMGLYAAICLGLQSAFLTQEGVSRRWRIWHWYALACATATLLLCASRIALLAAVVVLAVQWLACRPQRLQLGGIMVAVLLVCLVGGRLLPAGGRLSSPDKVESGVGYRLELYQWSLQQSNPSLFGAGPSHVAAVLAGDKHAAPPVIQKTLDDGFIFWYSHNQFIDTYIQYGVVGLILFASLLAGSFRRLVSLLRKDRTQQELVSILCATALCITASAHLLVNTPSLELASIVWLAIFAAYSLQPRKPAKKQRPQQRSKIEI